MSTALDSKPLNGNGHADVNVDVDAAGEMTEVKPTSSVNSCSGISSSSSSSSSSTVVSKRARRRHQSKQNKLAIKQAEAEQKLKFQNRPYQTATGKEKEKEKEKENDDGDEREEKKTNGDIDEEMEEKTSIVKSEIASPSTSTTEIEFIPDTIDESSLTPAMAEMASVLERFQKRGEDSWKVGGDETNDESATGDGAKSKEERIDEEIRAQSNETNSNEAGTLSRRKQKERDRLAIADLKQLVAKPDVVELHDVASADPKLLVYLKSFRNTVPVPQHWSQKRKYLQNKRGYEKAPFKLPECIENTGISKMRGAQQEKEAKQTNKQQQRAKMQPKMGKIDIDYQILHDAFFRYQTKPPMTQHGELYYEGREHELKMTEKKPGHYSNALREALGMKDETSPPPWLLRMQTVGPPPAYPYLAIPGVSAPIPTGARYGFGEGEWGKPPVDIHGRPLYGDVFGVERRSQAEIEKIDTTLWGGLEPESEGEEEEEEEAEGDTGMEDHPMDEVAHIDGTSSTLTSMSGLSTPEVLNLRKADGTGTETPDTITQRSKSLYTVLEEKKVGVGGGIFGTQHTYVLPDGSEVNSLTQFGPELSDQAKRIAVQQAKNRGQVDVALNPDELEGLDAAALKRKYDAKLLEASELSKKRMSAVEDEDEEENRKKKRKKGGSDKDKAYKDFKF